MKTKKQENVEKLLEGLPTIANIAGNFPKGWLRSFPYEILERVAIMTEDGNLDDKTALNLALNMKGV